MRNASKRDAAISRTTRNSALLKNGRYGYAREMYLSPEKIDAAFYEEGRKHYTEAQIMELGAFIAFHYGMQAFTRTLDLS